MTPADLDLARRAVACAGWRWLGGVCWEAVGDCPLCHGAGGFRWREADGSESGEACPCSGRLDYRLAVSDAQNMVGALPDLTDPATLGCLLALVREAHGDPLIHVLPCTHGGVTEWRAWTDSAADPYWCGPTEAAALVAGLEAACHQA